MCWVLFLCYDYHYVDGEQSAFGRREGDGDGGFEYCGTDGSVGGDEAVS